MCKAWEYWIWNMWWACCGVRPACPPGKVGRSAVETWLCHQAWHHQLHSQLNCMHVILLILALPNSKTLYCCLKALAFFFYQLLPTKYCMLLFTWPEGSSRHQGQSPKSIGMQKPHPSPRDDSSWQCQCGNCITNSCSLWHLPHAAAGKAGRAELKLRQTTRPCFKAMLWLGGVLYFHLTFSLDGKTMRAAVNPSDAVNWFSVIASRFPQPCFSLGARLCRLISTSPGIAPVLLLI